MFKTICFLRSVVWHIWTAVIIIPLALLLVLSAPFSGWSWLYRIANWWGRSAVYGMKWICGVAWRFSGEAHWPTDGSKTIVLSKHQSAWETLAYLALSPRPLCFVYKKELHWIPFFGWAIGSMKMIHIDRSQRTTAFKKVVEQGQRVMKENRWVIMFPEGTRMARGKVGTYKTGGTRLACETGAQVLPLAVSSAKCWPKGSFIKYPGVIDISIGEPIASANHTPDSLMHEVQTWIESEMHRMDAEAYKN
ncbi:MAG: lysophospholipid acyltransferase family protein [Cytophagales bacterium]|nr:lysophospholipid acyltransferase family protein [Cytophagales bacterium]